MHNANDDNSQSIESMLQFHSGVSQQDFTPKLMLKIGESAKQRKKIILLFSILAAMFSLLLFSFINLESTFNALFSQHSVYVVSLLAFCFIGNCFWLLIEEK